jgi:RNA-directed DNA polymerase
MLLEILSSQTGLSRDRLLRFSKSSGLRYKVYEIDKRSGGKRVIEQPSKTVKMMQYLLIDNVFSKFPIHDLVHGYVKGGSIAKNALAHANHRFTSRLDFKDFFWSFKKADIKRFLKTKFSSGGSLNSHDIEFISGVSTRGDRLVMGAPSSPIITNIMMFDLDEALAKMCEPLNVIYTRYADDIFLSTNEPNILLDLIKEIVAKVSVYETVKLQLNFDKTSHLSRKYHREVTGLVIKSSGGVSIGRDRKRRYKSLIHEYRSGKLSVDDVKKLSGYIGWAYSIEPKFVESLEVKYGAEVLKKIRSAAWKAEE